MCFSKCFLFSTIDKIKGKILNNETLTDKEMEIDG